MSAFAALSTFQFSNENVHQFEKNQQGGKKVSGRIGQQ